MPRVCAPGRAKCQHLFAVSGSEQRKQSASGERHRRRKISSDVSTDGITIIPWVSNTGRGRAQVCRPAVSRPSGKRAEAGLTANFPNCYRCAVQIVRLSMIEMFFLVHGLRCLTLYQEVGYPPPPPPFLSAKTTTTHTPPVAGAFYPQPARRTA